MNLDPGTSFAAQSKTTQTLGIYGNTTQSQIFDYGNLSTAARTYNYSYLTDVNYTGLYIRNRVTSATVSSSTGTLTLAAICYDYPDASCQGSAGGPVAPHDPPAGFDGGGGFRSVGRAMHDDATYGSSASYRGNPTRTVTFAGAKSMNYDLAGVVWQMTAGPLDGTGVTTNLPSDTQTGHSLPSQLSPNGGSNLATSFGYANSWAVSSVTGPNGDNGTMGYDGAGQPTHTVLPDGATIDYTYTYFPSANTQTATQTQPTQTQPLPLTGTRRTITTTDGFGRVTRVEQGHDLLTVTQVDTQYGPCACSPLGKMTRVSLPYAPGGTPVWARPKRGSVGNAGRRIRAPVAV